MNTFKHFLRLMGVASWRPRHYAAALYLVLSLLLLTGAEHMPWWGLALTVANLAVAGRWAMTIPTDDEDI